MTKPQATGLTSDLATALPPAAAAHPAPGSQPESASAAVSAGATRSLDGAQPARAPAHRTDPERAEIVLPPGAKRANRPNRQNRSPSTVG